MVVDGLVMVPEVFLMTGRGLGVACLVAFKPLSDTFNYLDTDFPLSSIWRHVTLKHCRLDEVGRNCWDLES